MLQLTLYHSLFVLKFFLLTWLFVFLLRLALYLNEWVNVMFLYHDLAVLLILDLKHQKVIVVYGILLLLH
jgi:hypothetical protein